MAGFVETYMQWTRTHMAPPRFHLFNALTVAAHALGRRVWLNREAKKATFPAQMMTLLIGPSGLKKTTSSDFAIDLLRAARQRLTKDEQVRINVMASRLSTEALWDDVVPFDGAGYRAADDRTDAVGLLYAPEMASTFGAANYMEGMSAAVTRLNDAPVGGFNWDKKRFEPGVLEASYKKDGPDRKVLWNPCIGMLAGTTPDGLADEMPMHIRTTGFLARVLPVWEMYSGRGMNLLLGPGERTDDLRERLVLCLAEMALLSGEVRVTPGAERMLGAVWGAGKVRQSNENPMLDAFIEREQDHTHRIAMVLAADATLQAGRTRHQKMIWADERQYDYALKLIAGCKEKLVDCYAPMGRKHHGGLQNYIMYYLKNRKRRMPDERGMSVWVLRRRVHSWSKQTVLTAELFQALKELEDVGKIRLEGTGRKQIAIVRETKPGPWSGQPATVDLAFVDGVKRQLAEDYEEPDARDALAEADRENRRRDQSWDEED
jgi:hypothetical protein